jgi:hypothetical protein
MRVLAVGALCAVGGLAAGLLLGLGGANVGAAGEADNAAKPATIVDKEFGYEMLMPRFPMPAKIPEGYVRSSFVAAPENGFAANVVISTDMIEANMSFSGYVTATLAILKASGMTVVGKAQTGKRDGNDFAVITLDSKQGGRDLRQMMVVVAADKRVVLGTVTSPKATFANYSNCFDEVLKSIKLVEKVGVGTAPKASEWKSDAAEEPKKTGKEDPKKTGK